MGGGLRGPPPGGRPPKSNSDLPATNIFQLVQASTFNRTLLLYSNYLPCNVLLAHQQQNIVPYLNTRIICFCKYLKRDSSINAGTFLFVFAISALGESTELSMCFSNNTKHILIYFGGIR